MLEEEEDQAAATQPDEERQSWADLSIFVDDEAGEDARRLNQPLLTQVVEQVLEMVGIQRPVEVTLLVQGDLGLRRLNRDYRSQDKSTDVLSFPLLDEPLVQAPAAERWQEVKAPEVRFVTAPGLPLHLGDVAISYPTVVRQAAEAKHSPLYEFAFLLAHGVLHLVGYDDQTEAGYRRMVELQHAALHQMGIHL
ncbi:MAG TPA: rRNA maturation RNase YbeY [Ktedonobacterales bacterium]|jgi:probable rRNA maturation factor